MKAQINNCDQNTITSKDKQAGRGIREMLCFNSQRIVK